ncbi:MAG: AMP-binding protein [Prolixibacteraceae bacterium]|nr:AMP-binding protein [Prolixibacteraceae bacterium]
MKPSAHSTITTFIDQLAFSNPEQVISSFQDEINIYNIGELNNRANLLAKGFLYHGIGKGTPVALIIACTTNCLTFVLALAKVGAVLVPVDKNLELRLVEKILKNEKIHSIGFYADSYLKTFRQLIPNLTQNERGYLQSAQFPMLKNVITLGSLKNRGIFTTRELMLVGSHIDDIEMENLLEKIRPEDPFVHKIIFNKKEEMKVQRITHNEILKICTTFPALQNYLLNLI